MVTREQVDTFLIEGNKQSKVGNYDEAIKQYTEGLNLLEVDKATKERLKESEHKFIISALLQRRAETYEKVFKNMECIKDLNFLNKLKPNAKAASMAGDIYFKMGDFRNALKQYNISKQINQSHFYSSSYKNASICEENIKKQNKVEVERQDLLDDVFLNIFSYLSPYDLRKIRTVSYNFYRIANDNFLYGFLVKQRDKFLYDSTVESKFKEMSTKKDSQIINWRRIYEAKLDVGDVYYTGDKRHVYEHVPAMLCSQVTQRGITSISGKVAISENQYIYYTDSNYFNFIKTRV